MLECVKGRICLLNGIFIMMNGRGARQIPPSFHFFCCWLISFNMYLNHKFQLTIKLVITHEKKH
jgi:hypothetical protein